jgi:hypothetical protein
LQELAKYKLYISQFVIIFELAGSVKDSDQYGIQAAAITLVELDHADTRGNGLVREEKPSQN